MDNSSDDTITFDNEGRCNYCRAALAAPQASWSPQEKEKMLEELLTQIKHEGRGKPYDCVMGLSGGLDSSYLALLGYRWGLRVLTIHIDDGFDSEISKFNLAALVRATGFDYLSIEPDSHQYRELTKAYLRAGVPNIAIPQDNVLFASLHRKTKEHNIKYFASGANFALESILQRGNTHHAYDLTNLRDINNEFGASKIDKLPLLSTLGRIRDRRIVGLKTVQPLDLIDYRREVAFRELAEFSGFQYYGRKHLENQFTEFVQLYWFFHKFGVDKRTSHLSSMIVSGQLTRADALREMSEPIYNKDDMASCISAICDGLRLEREDLDRLVLAPPRQHDFYASEKNALWYRLGRRLGWAARLLGSSGQS